MSDRGGDWRSGPAYDYVDEIGVEKIAHEFLRRNDEYAADYARLHDAPAEDRPPSALARWGLRFRSGSKCPRRSSSHGVAAGSRAEYGDPDEIAGILVRELGLARGSICSDRVGP
jgi:hypothetical protein